MKDTSSANPVSPYCTGCGACVATSAGTLRMAWNRDGFLVPELTSDSPIPQEARDACPFQSEQSGVSTDEDLLGAQLFPDASNIDPKAGRYEGSYIGYSHEHRVTSSSGGIATYIFEKLLSSGAASHLFVVVADGSDYKYQMIGRDHPETNYSKTRYYPVTLDEFFEIARKLDGKIAVSGVACFVKAIRMRQQADSMLREKIAFVVGIICGGLKSRQFTEYLADSSGAGLAYSAAEYRVKDATKGASNYSFSAKDQAGNTRTIPMKLVGDMWGTGMFKAKACDFCTDVLTELADISLGDAWLPQYRTDGLGNSVVVARTTMADRIIRDGIQRGELCASSQPIEQIISSQRASFSHRHDALQFRLRQAKLFGCPSPGVRRRVLAGISLPFALVQIQRELTRSASIRAWRKSPCHSNFDKRMKVHRLALKVLTRINHWFR